MMGFVPSRGPQRIALRNDQGVKVGYLASIAGRQVLQSPEGKTVAVIKAFKRDYQISRQGAQGGTVLSPDNY